MSYRLSLLVVVVVVSATLLHSPPLSAAKGGGGHGGGGHGGGHAGGHSGSSGHSIGHSVGHSLGHIFGHGSAGRTGLVGKKPVGSVRNPVSVGSVGFKHHLARRRMFHGNALFFSGRCDSLRFSWRNFLFPDDSDCFGGSFAFDPFFYGGFSSADFWSDSLSNPGHFADSAEPADAVQSDLPASAEKPGAAAPLPSNAEEPVTLLQLLDGSMYGLKRYWLEGTDLHYLTTYGGENTVPLVRIDFAKTIELNATHGTRFDLTRTPPNP